MMILFVRISSMLAIGIPAVLYVFSFIKALAGGGASSGFDYSTVSTQLKPLRTAGIAFVVISWLTASCLKKSACLDAYAEISEACGKWGRIWIYYAFAFTAAAVLASLFRRQPLARAAEEFRNSGFAMGAFFLIVSFILNV